MPETYLITGNLTVSGNTNLFSDSIVPSGFTNYSFIPFIPGAGTSTYQTRYLLSNGTESTLPFAQIGPIANWPYATGIVIRFGFYESNMYQLPRWINTIKWVQITGAAIANLRTGINFVTHKTGENFKLPWTSFNDVPGSFFVRMMSKCYNVNERLDYIENSGAFALMPEQKIGFGTFEPTEKIDINGNLKVEETGFFGKIFINNEIFTINTNPDPRFILNKEYNPILGIVY